MESIKERRERWERNITEWKASGLSGAAWCRENQISYIQFLYWKDRFHVKAPGFVEVKDRRNTSGLVLECNGMRLHLESDFDERSLTKAVSVLRKLC